MLLGSGSFVYRKTWLRLKHTFIAAQLYFGEKANLNDLPQESQHQVRFALLQILSSDVDNLAANGRRRVQSQVEIFLLTETQGDKDWEPRSRKSSGHINTMFV